MSDEEKKEENEEKKESKISGFFHKMSQKLDSATYDMRLQGNFDTTHEKYTVYAGTSVLQSTPEIAVEERLDEGYLVTLDDDEQIAAGNLIECNRTGEVRHIASVEKTVLTVQFDGKNNERPALKIVLGGLAQKVDVIKVGNDFYLK